MFDKQQWLTPATTLLALVISGPLTAGETSGYDRLWGLVTLHEDPDGKLLRTFALSGRLQADAIWFDAEEGDFDDLVWRRFRFGFKAELAGDWTVQLEGDFDLNESAGEWYDRLTDAYVAWNPGAAIDLTLLKHSAGFTLDGATSSKKLLALERSNLTNNLWFPAEYFTGASLAGNIDGRWHYKAGVFSTDGDDGFSSFDASWFTLASLGYDWAGSLGLDKALVRVDYVYNERDARNNTRDFSNVVSLSSQWELGSWGIWTDLAAGKGYYGQSDLWGLSAMPFYNLSDRLQLVLRYTFMESEDDNGIRHGRYEGRIVGGRGDDYNELYAGFNLFFYDHKLKWQTGLEYARMKDDPGDGGEFDGWGFSTGLRAYW
jgi:phosphate-selective porin OprO/OprP